MIIHRLGYASIVTALALTPLTAAAQSPSEDEAQRIRSGIKEFLSDAFDFGPYGPGSSLVFEGGVTVTPNATGYDLAFGAATLEMEGALRFSLGSITGTLEPTADGRFYRVTWVLPDSVTITNLMLDETVTMNFGSNSGEGLFAPEYQTFLSMDGSLNDVTMDVAEELTQLHIPSITFTMDSQEIATGVFDLQEEVSVNGFSVTGPDAHVSIDKIGFTADFGGLNMAAYTALTKQLQDLMNPEGMAEPEAVFAELADILSSAGAPFDSGSGQYVISGLDVDADGTVITLADSGFGVTFSGLSGEAAEVGAQLHYSGLSGEPADDWSELVPSDVNLDLAVTDLPSAALGQALIGFLQSAGQMGIEMAGPMALMQVQGAIITAGTTVHLRDLSVTGALASFTASGTLAPSQTAAMGGVASGSLRFIGLEPLLRALRTDMILSAGDERLITALRDLGVSSTDEAGETAEEFLFELGEDGVMTLNGADIGPILDDM